MIRPRPTLSLRRESSELYGTLVSGLAYSIVPSTIMGATIAVVGLFAYDVLNSAAILLATCFGILASAAKIALVALHRLRLRSPWTSVEESRVWELWHAVTTCAVASSVGALSAGLFARPDHALHMLGTGLVFGYCSGIATRIYLRPRLAMAAMMIAALPASVSALTYGGPADVILGIVFVVFLGGSFESVRHIYDVSAKEIELRLTMARLARTDPLTGLCNRLALDGEAARFPSDEGGLVAVHCFDIDAFKSVNDRFGHEVGDDLLRALAERLKGLLGEGDIAVRLGGDEFVVLQTGLKRAEEAQRFARRLTDRLAEPYALAQQRITLGVSHGYAVLPARDAHIQDMMRLADAASYRAKARGGGVEAVA